MTSQPMTDTPVTSQPSLRPLPVVFNGRGGEYFGIWIVNIALTVLTLGIYSAWAKVRNKRYFYGNTEIAGASFDYLATGGQILKGRLIAVAVFFVFSVISSAISPEVYGLFILGLLLATPWLINAGLRFNARYSAYRGVRFRFTGSYWGACKAFFLYPLLGVITLGIMMPHAMQYMARYVVTQHAYGTEPFKFDATVRQYQSVVLGLVIGIIAAIAFIAIGFSQASILMIAVGFLATYGLLLAFKPLLFNVYWRGVNLQRNRFEATMPVGRFIWVFFSNSIMVALTLGLAFPWAQVRLARLNATSLTFLHAGNIGTIAASQAKEMSALGEELGEVYDVDVGFGI